VDRWEYGYIAEELDSIGLNSLVGYSGEGLPEYIDYEKIVLYLTEMVKMHQVAISQQEKVIQELKEALKIKNRKKSGHRSK